MPIIHNSTVNGYTIQTFRFGCYITVHCIYLANYYYEVIFKCTCNTIIIDDVPTLAALSMLQTSQGKKIHIIQRMAPFWRDLGSLMDFDDSGSEVDIIDLKHRGDPKDCCRAIFQHWVNGNGVEPHSWYKLIELIQDCEQEALADEIQAMLS